MRQFSRIKTEEVSLVNSSIIFLSNLVYVNLPNDKLTSKIAQDKPKFEDNEKIDSNEYEYIEAYIPDNSNTLPKINSDSPTKNSSSHISNESKLKYDQGISPDRYQNFERKTFADTNYDPKVEYEEIDYINITPKEEDSKKITIAINNKGTGFNLVNKIDVWTLHFLHKLFDPKVDFMKSELDEDSQKKMQYLQLSHEFYKNSSPQNQYETTLYLYEFLKLIARHLLIISFLSRFFLCFIMLSIVISMFKCCFHFLIKLILCSCC